MIGELTFGIAETEADRRVAYALRYTAIVESHWRGPEVFPEGLEHDADDGHAIHLVSRLDGEIVGTMRLIVERSRVEELLREHELDGLYGAGDTMFVGRLTVARPHRSRSREVTVGLYAELIRVAAEQGIRHAISFLAENAVRFYRKQGFPLKLVGPPREDTGVPASPGGLRRRSARRVHALGERCGAEAHDRTRRAVDVTGARRRVVVSGLGVVSPLGNTVDDFWSALVAGRSGVGPIRRFDASGLTTSVAAEVKSFDPLEHADGRTVRTTDPTAIYLLAACREAIGGAGLAQPSDPSSVAVVVGLDVGTGEPPKAALGLERDGQVGVDSSALVQGLPITAGSLVAHTFGFRGAQFALSAACASGVVALLQAWNLIQLGLRRRSGCRLRIDARPTARRDVRGGADPDAKSRSRHCQPPVRPAPRRLCDRRRGGRRRPRGARTRAGSRRADHRRAPRRLAELLDGRLYGQPGDRHRSAA